MSTGAVVLMNTECLSIIGCHKYFRVKGQGTGRVRKQQKRLTLTVAGHE